MKRKSAPEESKSIKTFLLYSALVFFVILIAFVIKGFFIFQKSTFDGQSQYTLLITKQDQVEEILSFNRTNDTIQLLQLKKSEIPAASVSKFLSVIPDATVDVNEDFNLTTDVTKTLTDIGLQYNFVRSDATIIDIIRLGLFSKNVSLGNRTIEGKTFTKKDIAQEKKIDEVISDLFIDNQLSSENVSIQIINASTLSGMGSRLERVLVNLGGNVVSVSTSRTEEPISKIQYFNRESYTLTRLTKLLDFPVTKLDKETIANIVIIIGSDSKSTMKF